jgi:hypothetical protein
MIMAVDLELANRVVSYLNELAELDRPCIGALIANRIPCNKALSDHPTCQVSSQHGGCHVGLLGLLNGLCGSYDDGPKKGWGAIAAVFDKAPQGRYVYLKGFSIFPNEETAEEKNE